VVSGSRPRRCGVLLLRWREYGTLPLGGDNRGTVGAIVRRLEL